MCINIHTIQSIIILKNVKSPLDNMVIMCLLSNQVLEKHLKIPSGLVAEITNLLNIKDFDSLYAIAYNGLVGCGYAIQYLYRKGVTTDLVPCFSAPGALFRVSMKNLYYQGVHYEQSYRN